MGKALWMVVGASVAVAAVTTPVVAAEAPRPATIAHETPFVARVLPVAAMALIGGAVGFFILPFALPTGAALTASTGTSPILGVVGAGLGGLVGSQLGD